MNLRDHTPAELLQRELDAGAADLHMARDILSRTACAVLRRGDVELAERFALAEEIAQREQHKQWAVEA